MLAFSPVSALSVSLHTLFSLSLSLSVALSLSLARAVYSTLFVYVRETLSSRASPAASWWLVGQRSSLILASTSLMSAPTTGRSSSAELRKNLKVGKEETWLSPMTTGFSSASMERKVTAA